MGPLAWFVQGIHKVPAQKFAKRRLIDESPSQPPCDGDRSTTYHIAAAHATCAAIQGEKKTRKAGNIFRGKRGELPRRNYPLYPRALCGKEMVLVEP